MVSRPHDRRDQRLQTRRAERARHRLAVFWLVFPATVALVIVVAFVLHAVL
jgi:hypothetical protein